MESPRVDAELLLAHVLDVPRGRLLTLDQVIDGDLDAVIDALAAAHTAELLAAGS